MHTLRTAGVINAPGRQLDLQLQPAAQALTTRARANNLVLEARELIVATLARLCANGHCAIAESTLLLHAEQQTAVGHARLLSALRRALRKHQLERDVVDGTSLIFPPRIRGAEVTIARSAHRLANGPHVSERGRGKLEKFSLLCSSSTSRTHELVRRLLTAVDALAYSPVLLAPDGETAALHSGHLGRCVFELEPWTRRQSRLATRLDNELSQIVIVLAASRIGVEEMAAVLGVVPQSAAVMLVGDHNEIPIHGHGQPFRDLVACGLFQSLIADDSRRTEPAGRIAPERRSALRWRLHRGASR